MCRRAATLVAGLATGIAPDPHTDTVREGFPRHRRPALRVLVVVGTRPEMIKFLPIFRELAKRSTIELTTVLTSQHTDLIRPLIDLWGIRVDHDLDVMTKGQSLNELAARVIGRMDAVLAEATPDVVLVQGDTTSALGAAMAAWHRRIPVAHLEAGLRTACIDTPFPEEANRRLISCLATLHFAPTQRNVAALLSEGTPSSGVICSGNTIVDAVRLIHGSHIPSPTIARLLEDLAGQRIIVLTTHRRESFGTVLRDRLRTLRRFVQTRPDLHVVFPVHPNPQVSEVATEELGTAKRFHLLPPLDYPDFLHLLGASWAIVSDSGGIQEEAPSLGKPLLILRSETERPEVIECGVARLVGQSVEQFRAALEDLDAPDSWASKIGQTPNPFGKGDSARLVVNALLHWNEQRNVRAPQEMMT